MSAHMMRLLNEAGNETTTATPASPRICEPGGRGLFLPFSQGENTWASGPRAVLYGALLMWFFIGVAIIADVFMVAIEEITSKKRTVLIKGKRFHVKTWNDTVANLSLMALGSSAPEIILAVLEIVGQKMFTGDLGPSTIVGSASFNLLVISAVCIIGIPKGEVRRINDLNVFAVTATFSVFAYLWLLCVLQWVSPNEVEPWEAIVTFSFFWILLILAFLADKGYLSSKYAGAGDDAAGIGGTKAKVTDAHLIAGGFDPEDVARILKTVREEYGDKITPEQANKLAVFRLLGQRKKTRAEYRVEATRSIIGGKKGNKVKLGGIDNEEIVRREIALAKAKGVNAGRATVVPDVTPLDSIESGGSQTATPRKEGPVDPNLSIVQFSSAVHGFLESAGTIKVAVQRTGNVNQPMVVNYETRDQTAVSGDDYIATAGELQFAAGECIKDIAVTLVDDNQWEPDETFDIVLSLPTKQPEGSKGAVLGDPAVSTITIINDDEPGVLVFSEEAYTVNEKDEKIEITVLRKNGSDGTVTCKYKTQDHSDKSAVAGHDYEETEGTLVFDHGEISKSFTIKIMNDESYEKDEHFQVELFEATGGATFPDDSHGHTEVEVAIITIVNDQELKGIVDKISSTLNVNMDRMKLGSNNWGSQFSDALKVKPDDDDDDDDDGGEPTVSDYITHYIALPWKVIFALCPPADFGGGWLCFFCSLAMIGVVTGFIGDLAGLFGCVIGLKDSVTAITFVALGTSLPDTFASMAAATQDPYADASIGNVTGSNSVNVFLGLGLPWMLASVYWTSIKKEDNAKLWSTWTSKYSEYSWFAEFEQADKFRFVVPAGSLGFSVAVFSSLAVSCILFLLLRRKIAGGELGGPEGLRWVSFALLVTFWFTYIILSSLKAYEII